MKCYHFAIGNNTIDSSTDMGKEGTFALGNTDVLVFLHISLRKAQ